ncbi:MAG: hypothetical protein ACR2MP_22085 [Streptosporangiaceae bacterium]
MAFPSDLDIARCGAQAAGTCDELRRAFDVGTSAGIARKYGLLLTNLRGTAGPDRFIRGAGRGL